MLAKSNIGLQCFRPLDGESFSKLIMMSKAIEKIVGRFRPLDGESFSKLWAKD